MKRILLPLMFFIYTTFFLGQQVNTNVISDSINFNSKKDMKFNPKALIIPAILISYGVLATDNGQLKFYNTELKAEVKEHIKFKTTIDDFSQYAPLASIFILDIVGVSGKNKMRDKAIIVSTASLIMGISVASIKKISHIERPDGSSFHSFPSGHTATAFMGAELLYQEYKDVSYWYGISGYFVAAGTGAYRMINNRHWLSDVAAGAGIGILSAKLAYWLFPRIDKILTKNSETSNKKISFLPYYNEKNVGFGFVSTF
ncbi:phosphatase PAP2 family protein [Flavobacterium sp.]|uniref:phosphatase PAP2 family protein n=1 Tax=Flavobacterium sp. TaxID=239 RepID=UPI0033413C93